MPNCICRLLKHSVVALPRCDLNANFYARLARAPLGEFFYADENEIAEGVAPEEVVARLAAFLDMKDAALDTTPVHFISLNPSHGRLAQLSDQRTVNRAVRRLARARADLHYVDVATPMLDGGRPMDIFVEDGPHMSACGYGIWSDVIRPLVLREVARERPPCNPNTNAGATP